MGHIFALYANFFVEKNIKIILKTGLTFNVDHSIIDAVEKNKKRQ
jgi:hypothetical protein